MAEIFFLEVREEIFSWGIVPTVATSRHGRDDVILLHKDIMIRLGCVLVPLVTMEDQSIRDLFVFFGLLQSAEHERDIIAFMNDMPDNKTIEEILDDGQEVPAFLSADIGNIGDPFLVGCMGDKVLRKHVRIAMVGA